MSCQKFKVGLGIDSHAFLKNNVKKPLVLGGVIIPEAPGLKGNSDADVIFHALTDAISSITGRNIIGEISDTMCKRGITNSLAYLELAMADLNQLQYEIEHISIALEAAKPKLEPYLQKIRNNIAKTLHLIPNQVGITVTSGERLSDYGRGLGIKAVVAVTIMYEG